MSNVIYLRVPVSTAVVAGTALSTAMTPGQVFETAASTPFTCFLTSLQREARGRGMATEGGGIVSREQGAQIE